MSQPTPREKMCEVIETLMRGPAAGYLAGRRGPLTQDDEVDARLKGWLATWVIPQLQDIERKVFKPTPRQLDHFELCLSEADHAVVKDRTNLLVMRMRRPDAKRKALLELYDERRHNTAKGAK